MSPRFAALAAGAAVVVLIAAAPGRAQTFTTRDEPLYTPLEEAQLDARLHADLDSLTEDPVRGVYRSRHGRRADTFVDAIPFLSRRLAGTSAPPTAFPTVWRPRVPMIDSVMEAEDCFYQKVSDTLSLAVCNLHLTVPAEIWGRENRRGKVIVCAHYDSDGNLNGPKWHWESDPAPGADDDGSGCAAVLELARELSGLSLPFDVQFALFGGEEFGCFGSRHEAALAQARGDSILAVINLDMLAYAPRLDSLYVITDARSEWLADSLVRVSRRAWADGPGLSRYVEAFPTDDSDHAPFRDLGWPAVMISEATVPPRTNPTTHTLGDTLGNLSMRAIRRTVQLVGLWLRELAEPAVALDSVPLPALGSRDAPNPATILESDDSLTLGGSVARVLSGVAEAQTWQILDMLYPFVSPPPPGPPASPRFGVGFPLCSVPGGVGFRPGTRVRLGPRRVGLRARDYGSYVLEEYWYHPPGRVGIEWLADWESWVRMVPRAGRADWDLGPHPNPLDPAAYPAATRVALRPGTPVDVRLLDVAGRAVYHARDAVRDAPGMAWVALAPPGAATLRSGIYFYQLTLGDGRQSHGRLVLLR